MENKFLEKWYVRRDGKPARCVVLTADFNQRDGEDMIDYISDQLVRGVVHKKDLTDDKPEAKTCLTLKNRFDVVQLKEQRRCQSATLDRIKELKEDLKKTDRDIKKISDAIKKNMKKLKESKKGKRGKRALGGK